MKIGIYDPYLDTMSGGEKYMLTAAQTLTSEHDVTLFWSKDDKEAIIKKAEDRFGMNLSKLTFADSLFGQGISTATRYRRSREYDAIFILSDGSIPLLACDLYIHFQSPMEWVKITPFVKLKIKRVKEFICNSAFTKNYIDKKFGVRSTVITPPVLIQKEYSESKKEKRILHVGRFGISANGSSYKKQDILADTFSDMVKKGLTGWNLVLVMGVMDKDMDAASRFRSKHEKLPIEIVVNPTNERLWTEYEKAGIYWHASGFGEDLEHHPDRAEHFGISTVEAMGAGAVPVVYAAGGQKEIIQDAKNGFFWQTKSELAAITLDLTEHPTKRKSLAIEAVKRSDFYRIGIFNDKIRALLK